MSDGPDRPADSPDAPSSDAPAADGPDTPSSDAPAADGPDAPSTGDSGTATSGDAARPSGLDGPQRLHPLTIPYRLAQQGVAVVLFVLFAGVPSLTGALGSRGSLLALLAVVVVAAGLVGYAVTWYRRYEYELTADTFDIRSGVLSRREREIPLRRVQNVDISQSVVQRVLGIAVVSLETAGGGETEAQLQYVGEDEADALQGAVSRLRRGRDAAEGSPEPPSETVFAITERELGVLALVSTDVRVVSLLFFVGSLVGPRAVSSVEAPMFSSPEAFLGSLFGPVAGLAAVLVIGLVAGVFNAARYYGFTLARGEDELRYERGLLQQYSGTIPLSKVQTLTIKENPLARWLGYAALYIETAGHVTSGNDSGGSQSAIPLAERDRVLALARSIEDADLTEFRRPPRRARQRYAARYAIALLAFTGVVYVASRPFGVGAYWWLPLVGLAVVPVAAHLKWRQRGYVLGDEHVVTRNGFWSRETKVVPYHRVQTSVSTETVFQRRRGLGTVVVDTAGARSFGGGDPKAVDVDTETADDLRETVADRLYAALADRAREPGDVRPGDHDDATPPGKRAGPDSSPTGD